MKRDGAAHFYGSFGGVGFFLQPGFSWNPKWSQADSGSAFQYAQPFFFFRRFRRLHHATAGAVVLLEDIH